MPRSRKVESDDRGAELEGSRRNAAAAAEMASRFYRGLRSPSAGRDGLGWAGTGRVGMGQSIVVDLVTKLV